MSQFSEGLTRAGKGIAKVAFSAVAAGIVYGGTVASLGALPLYIGLKSDFQFVGQIAKVPYHLLHDGVRDVGLGLKMMGNLFDMDRKKIEQGFRYLPKNKPS